MRQIPKGPTKEEIRRHNATHCPYRSWCPKCVAGRGHQGPHNASEEPLDNTPMVSLDYCFLRRTTEEASVPILVAKVRKKNLLFVHVVPCKGASHREVVAMLAKDLSRIRTAKAANKMRTRWSLHAR